MASRDNKICIICGKEFIPANMQAKVCSDECRAEKKKRYYAEIHQKNREATKERNGIRICVVCGKEFEPRNCRMVTCNPECTRTRHNLQKIELRKQQKEEKGKKKADKKEPMWKVNEKARALGMSYGKYQVMKQLEAQRKERANGH